MSTTNREDQSPVIDDELIEKLMAQVDAEGVELLGPDGVLTELTKRVMAATATRPSGDRPVPVTSTVIELSGAI